jgi:hypothetical protein
MRYLAQRKIAIAEKLGSRALRADAMEAIMRPVRGRF